jgi:signal transduction histidine kinase
MRSLLGVPLVRRGKVIGNLYLTDKEDEAAFNERDEEIVRVLATQAAAAIDNAELYQSEYRLAQESKALFELGRQVSSSFDLTELLPSVAAQARDLLQTDTAAIMLLRPDHDLTMAAHAGLIKTGPGDKCLVGDDGLQNLALSLMEPVVVLNAKTDERLIDGGIFVENQALASLVCIPLRGKQGPLGTITVGNRHQTLFDERAVELLGALANYIGVAIETARLQERLESLARLEERERIAMDLHDGVIQSVYAVGLHLDDASERLPNSPREVKAIVQKAMDDLHQVINDIRSYIFDLRPQVSEVADLPGALEELAETVRVNTLMTVGVDVPEAINGMLGDSQALALFHIAQEAMNNISKHSQATKVHLKLAVGDQRVCLEIEDNGLGFDLKEDRPGERHGLRNMKDRARAISASMFVDSEPGHGTIVRVELPVQQEARYTDDA